MPRKLMLVVALVAVMVPLFGAAALAARPDHPVQEHTLLRLRQRRQDLAPIGNGKRQDHREVRPRPHPCHQVWPGERRDQGRPGSDKINVRRR